MSSPAILVTGLSLRSMDLYTRQRADKVVLTLLQGSHVLPPVPVQTSAGAPSDRLAVVTNTGRLLVFARTALPA